MTGKLILSTLRFPAAAGAALLAGMLAGSPAQAVEGGFSIYLLGSGGPDAAVLPPLEGVFYDNTTYIYDASAGAERQIPLGGNLAAGIDVAAVFNLNSALWVPTTDFLGGTLAVGAVIGVGYLDVHADAVITGPLGNEVTIERKDDIFTIGDPALAGSLGWKSGKLYSALSVLVSLPIGDYHPGRLANISLNRFAVDTSFALSWHDDEAGWDISAKIGYTYNGTNPATDYNSGDDLHVEAAIEKKLGKFSLGLQGYYYNQVSADKGAGARLGAFEGEVAAIGGTAAYNFMIGRAPVSVRAKVLREFNVTNRFKGTEIFLSLGMPLWVNMPKPKVD
jgi:hypothetical protein